MRIYYFGELVTDTNKNSQSPVDTASEYPVRQIREVVDGSPSSSGQTTLSFHRNRKFVIRNFAHA